MTNNEEKIEDLEELENKIEEITENENEIDEVDIEEISKEDEKCNDILSRTVADFENFKMRAERDRQEMVFFLKSDIIGKILPRLDDLERIIKNTPETEQGSALFEGVLVLQKKLIKDLEGMGITTFDTIGEDANPDMHEVMTQVPGGEEGKIVDEFEKGYKLGDKILRVAKVVVGLGG